jgi:hypothetical protein
VASADHADNVRVFYVSGQYHLRAGHAGGLRETPADKVLRSHTGSAFGTFASAD